jgi:hypothetical protein
LFFDFGGVSFWVLSTFLDRLGESSGQEPGTCIRISGTSTAGVSVFVCERLLGGCGLSIAPAISTEETALDEGAETLRLRRSSLVRDDFGFSFKSSLVERMSLVIVCFALGDATDFGFDSEPDDGVELEFDDFGFESEVD